MAEPQRWLATPGPADYVRLLPLDGSGPDVFVKLADYERIMADLRALAAYVGVAAYEGTPPPLAAVEIADKYDASYPRKESGNG